MNQLIIPLTGPDIPKAQRIIILALANFFIFSVAYVYLQGILIYRVDAQLQAGSRPLATSIGLPFRRLLPLAIASLPASIGHVLSLLARLIPEAAIAFYAGLIILTFAAVVFLPSAPACLAENIGSGDALRRGAYLTDGNRLKAFGALLVMTGIYFCIGFVIGFAGSVIIKIIPSYGVAAFIQSRIFALITFLTLFLDAIFRDVVYHRLRAMRDGTRIDKVSDIFA